MHSIRQDEVQKHYKANSPKCEVFAVYKNDLKVPNLRQFAC